MADVMLRLNSSGSWGENVQLAYRASPSSSYVSVSGFAGALDFTYVSGTHLTDPAGAAAGFNPDHFLTFCTDAGAELQWGNSYNYTPQLFAGQDGVSPSWKMDGIYAAAWLFNQELGGVKTAAQAAGLQMAIWEELYDFGSTSLSGGNLKITSASSGALSAANGFLADVNARSLAELEAYDSTWLHPNPEAQHGNLVQGLLYGDTTPLTPSLEPTVPDGGTTLFLLSLAILGLGSLRRFARF